MHKKTPRSIITYFYGSRKKKSGKIAQINKLASIRRLRSFILARIKHIQSRYLATPKKAALIDIEQR